MKLFNLKRLMVGLGISMASWWLGLQLGVQPVSASTNLDVSCPSTGSCTITPSGTPLLSEANWYPGATASPKFSVQNVSGQDGCVGVEAVDYAESNSLGEIIQIEIRRDSPTGDLIYGGVTLHQFRDDGYFTIDAINDGQTKDYYLLAAMPTTAGNEYRGSDLKFDLNLGLELVAIAQTNGGGDGTGKVLGAAAKYVCNAQEPTSAPIVTITNVGTNTVSLSWTPVSPITHYALIFTDDNTGVQYGSPDIGGGTDYTVTHLSGGTSYTFEIFGVNDCAPGPRGSANTGTVAGLPLTGRPAGPGGAVLGVEELASPTPTPQVGQVAGTVSSSCDWWRLYLPLILLVAQFMLLVLTDVLARRISKKSRPYIKFLTLALITLLSIIIFYWLRDCQCYATPSIGGWLCEWYWLAALIVTLLTKVFSYAFIEEVEPRSK